MTQQPADEPEFDCHVCFVNAEEAAERAMLGWSGIVDYYREFRESCDHMTEGGE